MREDLIAYALGELDDAECQRIEDALASDATLREELEQIKACLADNDCSEVEDELPPDLADRTTAGILSGCLSDSQELDEQDYQPASAAEFGPASRLLSPMDMTVALGVLIAVGSLLFPAVYGSRNRAQQTTCANNLQQLGQLLHMYAEKNHGFYPIVRPNEHAGIFASRLREADFVRPDMLDDILVCPSSPLAERLAEEQRSFHVPSLAETLLSKGMLNEELRRTSSGSYGYQPGYVKGIYYMPMKNQQHSQVPVVADAPSLATNHYLSDNHGGGVVNTLFQNGTVLTLTSPQVPCSNDWLYFNDEGQPAVGTQWNDAVVLPSGATPGVGIRPMPEAVYRIFIRVR